MLFFNNNFDTKKSVPPIFVEIKCPVPTSNLSYFFMSKTQLYVILSATNFDIYFTN